jgi:hypothetical protein
MSCENKDLTYGHPSNKPINVSIHWGDETAIPSKGMRINLFSLNQYPDYGMHDLNGNKEEDIYLSIGSSYLSLCYDYFGSNSIFFYNENSKAIEAYCRPLINDNYTKNFPDEKTVAEPGTFYLDIVDKFDVVESEDVQQLDFYPKNVSKTYTFKLSGVKGAEYINAVRGALSGISASYFLVTKTLADTPSTVLFNASADKKNECITGSFTTFGRVSSATNYFTIEIAYPSVDNKIILKRWDVRNKLIAAEKDGIFHIEIDADIIVEPEEGAGSGDGGFDVSVGEWENETVPVHP